MTNLACHVMTLSRSHLPFKKVFNSFGFSTQKESDNTFVFFCDEMFGSIRFCEIEKREPYYESLPKFNAIFQVNINYNSDSKQNKKKASIKVANLMTEILTALNRCTESVGVMWASRFISVVDWEGWLKTEFLLPLWVNVYELLSYDGSILQSQGLSFFGVNEIESCADASIDVQDHSDLLYLTAKHLLENQFDFDKPASAGSFEVIDGKFGCDVSSEYKGLKRSTENEGFAVFHFTQSTMQ